MENICDQNMFPAFLIQLIHCQAEVLVSQLVQCSWWEEPMTLNALSMEKGCNFDRTDCALGFIFEIVIDWCGS